MNAREPLAASQRRGSLQGERTQRHCTDVIWCLFFLVCLGAFALLGVLGFQYGQPKMLDRLIYGTDSLNRMCGVDAGVKEFPLTYFTLSPDFSGKLPQDGDWSSVIKGQLRPVCTTQCPNTTQTHTLLYYRDLSLCPADAAKNCTWYGGDTVRFANYCVDTSVFSVEVPWEQYAQDLLAVLPLLCSLPFVAVLTGFMFLVFVDRCGALIIWAALALATLVPGLLGLYVYYGATHTKGDELSNAINQISNDPNTQKNIAYGLWALSGLVVLLICCFARTVNAIVSVLKATSQFLRDVPSQMVQPFFFGFCHLVVFVAWVGVFVVVASIGAEAGDQDVCMKAGDIYCLKWDSQVQMYGLLFCVVMLYWMLNYLHALSHYGTAYCVGEWYFASTNPMTGKKEPSGGGSTCCDFRLSAKAVGKGFLYHSGSLAFGAFVVSIAKVATLVLWFFAKKEEATNINPLVRCAIKCAACLADCFERFIEFVSENAYVEVALQGFGFCQACRTSLAMAVLRPGLFGLVGRVACMIRLVGMATVTCVVAGFTIGILSIWSPEGMGSIEAPLIAAVVVAVVIGEVMMHPFSAAARAAVHCYCMDAHTSESQSPQYAPEAMQTFVEDNSEDSHRGCCC